MEIAGLTISVAGLATLFDLCLRGFDLLEQGKDFSRDHTILIARLNAQRAIFTIWGEAVGLSASNGATHDLFSLDSGLRSVVKGHLDCISLIFEDATLLSDKYGLKSAQNHSRQPSTETPLRAYLSWFQKKTSHRRKAKWVIRDLAKFKSMLDDLSKLITDLREITSSLADIRRQREVFVGEEIAQRTEIEELEIIEEALSHDDPTLSSAASERRTALTQTAFTIRSLPGPSMDRHEDDDMHTHADSDPDAQFGDVNEASNGNDNEVQLEDDEKPQEVSGMYGHQNNLSEIQKEDVISIARSADMEFGGLSKFARKWILKELNRFHDRGSETPFISIGFPNNVDGTDQLNNLIGKFQAPPNTPYEGGVFAVSMKIHKDHPWRPPYCRFITPVYHPNIDERGRICVDILGIDWSPAHTLEYILASLCSLLDCPNCDHDDHPLRPEVAKEFLQDRYQFDKKARLLTQRFASRDYQQYPISRESPW